MNPIKKMSVLYIAGLLIFIALDFLWFRYLMAGFYFEHLNLMARVGLNKLAPLLAPNLGVYILLSLGQLVFVVRSQPNSRQHLSALARGSLLGLIIYGTYNLANLALIYNWSPSVVIVDTLWGIFSCGLCGLILSFIRSRIDLSTVPSDIAQ